MKAIGAMIVAGVMFLSGCALLEQVEQSPLASHIAVQQATLRYIDGDVEKAQRVVAVAEKVEEYASGTVTVALLTTYLRAQIKWEQLAVADVMLLDALLLELESRLVERMGEGELSPEDLANVEKVVDWVILYASMEL
jgi:hypothetical protein